MSQRHELVQKTVLGSTSEWKYGTVVPRQEDEAKMVERSGTGVPVNDVPFRGKVYALSIN